MAEVVELDDRRAGISRENYIWRPPQHCSSEDRGGNVEEILKRLNAVEVQVSAIAAVIPHLATKSDLSGLETRVIKWIVATMITSLATMIASVGLAFTIAKIVH